MGTKTLGFLLLEKSMLNTNSPLNLAKWRIGIGKSIEINHAAWFTPKIDNT